MWPVAIILSSTALNFRAMSSMLMAISCMTLGKLLNTLDRQVFFLYEMRIMNSPFLFIFSPEKLTIGGLHLRSTLSMLVVVFSPRKGKTCGALQADEALRK